MTLVPSSPPRARSPRARASSGLALLALALTTSCATYPERTGNALNVFQSGQFERASEIYEEVDTTGSKFLSAAEAGSAAFAAGEWDRTLELWSKAAAIARDDERAALISAESLAESLPALAISERAADYTGEGYERVQLHAGLAMAYLAKGQFESARVEVRRANALLENQEELYEKEYRAGGLGHLVSALAYELEESYDDAWIDYMRMLEKGVGSDLAGRALVRLARRMHREQEVPELMERYGAEPPPPDGAASVLVIGGLGLGPYKREITIPVPTPDGFLQWSVPTFQERPQLVVGLRIEAPDLDAAVLSDSVEDVTVVAKENLEDRIAWLAGRSAVRGIAKRELTQHLQSEYGGIGRLAGDLFTIVTERADLRAWQTLPSQWHAARMFLPAGEVRLRLACEGGSCATELGRYALEPGETLFVFARQVGATLAAHPIGGRRLDLPVTPESTTAEAFEPGEFQQDMFQNSTIQPSTGAANP